MIKNCLTFLGIVFIGLLAVGGILLTLIFFDLTGITNPPVLLNGTPFAPPIRINGTAIAPPDVSGPVATLMNGAPKIIRTNPLETQPLPTPIVTLAPTPTPTPVPTLSPVAYRSTVIVRAKAFGTALDSFMKANQQLAADNKLLTDPTWRGQMEPILDQLAASGQALSETGPAPAEYTGIDVWIKRVGPEAVKLRQNYLQAMNHGDVSALAAAAKNFTNMAEYLRLANIEMTNAGWPAEP